MKKQTQSLLILTFLEVVTPPALLAAGKSNDSGWWSLAIAVVSGVLTVGVLFGTLKVRTSENQRRLNEHDTKLESLDREYDREIKSIHKRLDSIQKEIGEIPFKIIALSKDLKGLV
ncbi:MAG: hypothetical protein QNL04_00765 [SAR324 cluster bacterium]|nr:hypothetical protein [SAR324 cluster bacterium]